MKTKNKLKLTNRAFRILRRVMESGDTSPETTALVDEVDTLVWDINSDRLRSFKKAGKKMIKMEMALSPIPIAAECGEQRILDAV